MKHSMNPPVRWRYLGCLVGTALLMSALLTGLFALIAWEAPSTGWVWPIACGTVALTLALMVRDLFVHEDY